MSRRRRNKPAAALPAACDDCRPFGGLWRRSEPGAGLERCGCARGREIFDRSPAGKRAAQQATREARAGERARRAHDGRLAGAGGDE
jgi:hypothetical protein